MKALSFESWLEARGFFGAEDDARTQIPTQEPEVQAFSGASGPVTEPPTISPNKVWWRYGNYCGPGPKLMPKTCDRLATGDPLPAPINKVDGACQVHDMDYCRCGVNWTAGVIGSAGTSCSRGADEKLVKQIRNYIKAGLLSGKEKIAGDVVSKYFQAVAGLQRFMPWGMRRGRPEEAGTEPTV